MRENGSDIQQDKAAIQNLKVIAADLRAGQRWIMGILTAMAMAMIAIFVLLVVIALQLGG